MAKQVIVMRIGQGPGGDLDVSFLLWLAVTSAKAVPVAGGASQWSGASGAENAAIAAGTVAEESYSAQYPTGASKAAIQSDLLAKFTARQAQISARPNPNQFFGVSYDPAAGGWSA